MTRRPLRPIKEEGRYISPKEAEERRKARDEGVNSQLVFYAFMGVLYVISYPLRLAKKLWDNL